MRGKRVEEKILLEVRRQNQGRICSRGSNSIGYLVLYSIRSSESVQCKFDFFGIEEEEVKETSRYWLSNARERRQEFKKTLIQGAQLRIILNYAVSDALRKLRS
jgi:hypothetical protein